MMNIVYAILIMMGLGLFFGFIISIFQAKFKVEEDTRLTDINNLLPGANCGACGSAGCHDFAEKIFEGKIDENGCKVIKGEAKEQLHNYIKENLGDKA